MKIKECCYNCRRSEGCGENGIVFCRALRKRMSETDCCVDYVCESHTADPYE
jgi:hypothetical protein